MPPQRRTPTKEQQAKIARAVKARQRAEEAEAAYRQAVLEARDSDATLQAIADGLGVTRQNMDILIRKWRADAAPEAPDSSAS
jgi:hypothetical protein